MSPLRSTPTSPGSSHCAPRSSGTPAPGRRSRGRSTTRRPNSLKRTSGTWPPGRPSLAPVQRMPRRVRVGTRAGPELCPCKPLTQAQGAWAVMRTQLAAAEIANKGMVPYAGSNLYASLNPAQPLLDSSGNPGMLISLPRLTRPRRCEPQWPGTTPAHSTTAPPTGGSPRPSPRGTRRPPAPPRPSGPPSAATGCKTKPACGTTSPPRRTPPSAGPSSALGPGPRRHRHRLRLDRHRTLRPRPHLRFNLPATSPRPRLHGAHPD